MGLAVDRRLEKMGVRLTMGGEPTYVARDAPEDPQWQTEALGEDKRVRAERLLWRLRRRLAPGALVHFGLGKWYPEESLPRWALGCYWRRDGRPLWRHPELLAATRAEQGGRAEGAGAFLACLAGHLGVGDEFILPVAGREVDQRPPDASREPGRGYVLPLLRVPGTEGPVWASCRWQGPGSVMKPLPGEAPLGMRLPLASIDWVADEELAPEFDPERFQGPLSRRANGGVADNSIRVALCTEVRDGILHVFLPPMAGAESYPSLLACVEAAAVELGQPVRVEGFPPPPDPELVSFQITPDPGVIEINTHPAGDWPGMVAIAGALDEEARACGLTATKYLRDGRRTGSGGGHHLTLGARAPDQSPFFRRPDLLRSLLTYWQNHPGLSYGFAGLFIGPTCQAPRIDEARQESLAELELAFSKIRPCEPLEPLALGRLLQHLLVDLTGNGHRAEFCIDKLWPPGNRRGRLGLVELRGFEMQCHPRLDLVLALLVRALAVRFWEQPYRGELVRWGSALHDRFALPEFIAADLAAVAAELQGAGIPFQAGWLKPHLAFRFPVCGGLEATAGEEVVALELRQALEPWPVLEAAAASGASSRPVDSSCERLQVLVMADEPGRFAVLCNRRRVPLAEAGPGRAAGGIRFKAWPLAEALHPEIAPHAPLSLELVEIDSGRCLGGCRYHVGPPSGGDYRDFPADEQEARRRREERFRLLPGRPGPVSLPPLRLRAEAPWTLDLRYEEG